MDALSEALNAVRVTGAIFFNAEFIIPDSVLILLEFFFLKSPTLEKWDN